ncbi:hypothetical protein HYW67_04310 [Candidatus Parcubacteria bacterium]|nr:hypothetical protein [Candidatus Parcubacteria bacterium]
MAARSKLLTAKVRARIAAKVFEAQRRGIADEVLVWVERTVRTYEFAAADYGAVLVATASTLSTAEAFLHSSIEANDALGRRIRELEGRIRVLEAQLAIRRHRTVVPFARRQRPQRVDTVTQARR